MKLHVLSDLHTEFEGFDLPETDADVVILAGDTGVGLAGVKGAVDASCRLRKPVVYVAGNHEFYHNHKLLDKIPGCSAKDPVDGISTVTTLMRAAAHGSDVHVLENEAYSLDSLRVLGCTLWSDFMLFGEDLSDDAVGLSRQLVNDFRGTIRHLGRPFTPADAVVRFRASVAWLKGELAKPWQGHTVVVSHHAPSIRSVGPQFRNDPVSAAFASDLEELVCNHSIDLWVHGHMHQCFDYQIGNTRVLCNPRGYPHEENRFNSHLLVSLP
jgi:predicted phosphodiesterase